MFWCYFEEFVVFCLVFLIVVIVESVVQTCGVCILPHSVRSPGCYNTSSGQGSGSKDCYSTSSIDATVDPSQPQCLCSSTYDTTACYAYTLSSGDDCGSILTLYNRDLLASTIFLGLTLLALGVLVMLSCMSSCTRDSEISSDDQGPHVLIHQEDVDHVEENDTNRSRKKSDHSGRKHNKYDHEDDNQGVELIASPMSSGFNRV